MATDVDLDASGLLTELSGPARADRRGLIEWLLANGFDLDRIPGAAARRPAVVQRPGK